jgi:glutaconate CoA-transferase subunit A
MTMHEAVNTFVADGDEVYVAGFSHAIAYAAGHEMIRQKKRDLVLCRATPEIVFDQMVACGCARKLVFSWAGNPGLGNLHCINRALADGLEIEEYTHFGMMGRLVAGATGLPFYPLPHDSGADLARYNPMIRSLHSPYSDEIVTTVPPLRPDVAFIHAQRADSAGNVQLWGILGDIREAAFAARRVVVSVEELVDAEIVRRDPNRTIVPSFLVDAVVVEPWGAHPSYVQGYYDRDNRAYREWAEVSRDPDRVQEHLARYVYGIRDRREYVELVGDHARSLTGGTRLSEPVNYGTA